LNDIIKTDKTDGSTTSLGVGYAATEYVLTDSGYPNYFVGIGFGSDGTSLRFNKQGIGNTFVSHRADGIQKAYPHVFSKHNVSKGDIYTFTGTTFAGEKEGVSFSVSGK